MKVYLKTIEWHPFGGTYIRFTTDNVHLISSLPIEVEAIESALKILCDEKSSLRGWLADIVVKNGKVSDIQGLRKEG